MFEIAYSKCRLLALALAVALVLTVASASAPAQANDSAAPTMGASVKRATASPPASPAAAASARPVLLRSGDRCTGDPKFLQTFGLSKRALVDTTAEQAIGLVVTDVDPQGRVGRSAQHESWTQGGYLGRVQRDRNGNLYTYPAPSVTLVHNPIEKANIIYRVDSETAVMAPFVEISKAAPANERNPFGLLALALDCEQNALYAATVFGSTATQENGVIARVDLITKEVRIVRRGIDALSLLVVTDTRGKRLYVGAARDASIVSMGIEPDGGLSRDESVEIALSETGAAADKRARVMRVDNRGRLYVRAIAFEFTLAARSAIPTTEMTFAAPSRGERKFVLVEQRSSEVSPGASSVRQFGSASDSAARTREGQRLTPPPQ